MVPRSVHKADAHAGEDMRGAADLTVAVALDRAAQAMRTLSRRANNPEPRRSAPSTKYVLEQGLEAIEQARELVAQAHRDGPSVVGSG